jgi:hypothetical protein
MENRERDRPGTKPRDARNRLGDHGADGFPLGLKILVAALQADGEMRFNLENSDGNPRRWRGLASTGLFSFF